MRSHLTVYEPESAPPNHSTVVGLVASPAEVATEVTAPAPGAGVTEQYGASDCLEPRSKVQEVGEPVPATARKLRSLPDVSVGDVPQVPGTGASPGPIFPA